MSKLPLVEFFHNGLPQIINLQGFKCAHCIDAVFNGDDKRPRRVSHQIFLHWKHNLTKWYQWDNDPCARDDLYQRISQKLREGVDNTPAKKMCDQSQKIKDLEIEILSLNDTMCWQDDKIKELEEENRVIKSVIANSVDRLNKQAPKVEFLVDEEGKE
jgi:hypothetical protein